ncbi:hypothetical protein QNH20_18430 [Neobacillus sp. WH10]|uniref:hypothetical protein n=1 Tax=Neobacillus sp. WH10 TaxID=3047873 RepID=UPI0024C1222A|nr:hypothetical protein [Neobacillus sp. WH10]WHY76090.1 hypothetical protein QNH20_18430 [Neobacillus sp. WH10]
MATIKDDKTAEYEQLIGYLRRRLKQSKQVSDDKSKLIHKLRAKIEKYEHIVAACEDVKNEADTLKKERDNYRDQLLDTRDKLIRSDYTVENQKKHLENAGKTLVRYKKENKAFRELIALWI